MTDALHALLSRETPLSPYMHLQPNINEKMRVTLLQWLAEVIHVTKDNFHVFSRATCIIDQVMSVIIVERKNYQLLGVVALMIASKYHTVYDFPAQDICHLCANVYTVAQVTEMEREILSMPTVKCTLPCPVDFMEPACTHLTREKVLRMENTMDLLFVAHALSYADMTWLPSLTAYAVVRLCLDIFEVDNSSGCPCPHDEKQVRDAVRGLCRAVGRLDKDTKRLYNNFMVDKVVQHCSSLR